MCDDFGNIFCWWSDKAIDFEIDGLRWDSYNVDRFYPEV